MKHSHDLRENNNWRMWRFVGELADSYEKLDGVKGISIFGGHRLDHHSPLYHDIKQACAKLSNYGYDIITGGGAGVMAAANEGCQCGMSGKSVGLTVESLGEGGNPHCDIMMPFKHFAIRKYQFLYHSVALVFMPGGVGTLDELFTAYCLIQTKVIPGIPMICYDSTYWSGLFDWLRHTTCMQHGFMTFENFGLVEFVDEPQELVDCIIRSAPLDKDM